MSGPYLRKDTPDRNSETGKLCAYTVCVCGKNKKLFFPGPSTGAPVGSFATSVPNNGGTTVRCTFLPPLAPFLGGIPSILPGRLLATRPWSWGCPHKNVFLGGVFWRRGPRAPEVDLKNTTRIRMRTALRYHRAQAVSPTDSPIARKGEKKLGKLEKVIGIYL